MESQPFLPHTAFSVSKISFILHLIHHQLSRREHIVQGLGGVEPRVVQHSLDGQPFLGLHLQEPVEEKVKDCTLVDPDSKGISFHFGLSISSPKPRPSTCEAAVGSNPNHLLEGPVSLGGLFNITKTNELSVTMTLQGSSYLGTG